MADSPLARLHAWSTEHACAVIAIADEDSFEDPAAAVSYTHLTLPTIYSV